MEKSDPRFTSRGEWIVFLRRHPDLAIREDEAGRRLSLSAVSASLGRTTEATEADLAQLPRMVRDMQKGDWLVAAPKFLAGGPDGALPTEPGISWGVLNAFRAAGMRDPEVRLVDSAFVICAQK